MKADRIIDALGNADDMLLERAFDRMNKNRNKKTPGKILLLAATLTLIAGVIVTVLITAMRPETPHSGVVTSNAPSTTGKVPVTTEPGTTEPVTTGSTGQTTTDPGTVDPHPGADNYLIGKGVLIENENDTLVKELPTLNDYEVVVATAYYSALPVEAKALLGSDSGIDHCMELLSQWFSSMAVYDYERNFSLFQPEMVDHLFVQPAKRRYGVRGIDSYEKMIDIINKRISLFNFSDQKIDYSIDGVRNITDIFKSERKDYFDCAGLDISKVSTAYRISVSDLTVMLNERYYMEMHCGRFLIGENLPNLDFYCYDGRWYCSPCMMGQNFALDLLSENAGYITDEINYEGYVSEIGEKYIVLTLLPENQPIALLLGDAVDAKAGDYARVTVYRGAGAAVTLEPRSEGEEVFWRNAYSVKKIEVTEPPVTVDEHFEELKAELRELMLKYGCPADRLFEPVGMLDNDLREKIISFFCEEENMPAVSSDSFLDPEAINLASVMHAMLSNNGVITPKERETAVLASGDPHNGEFDLFRMSSAELDAWTMKYLGVHFSEKMAKTMITGDKEDPWVDKAYYLPEYDSYYFFCSDTNITVPSRLAKGFVDADGRIAIQSVYDDEFGIWGDNQIIILEPMGDFYRIVTVLKEWR